MQATKYDLWSMEDIINLECSTGEHAQIHFNIVTWVWPLPGKRRTMLR